MILVDGARYDVFRRLIDAGELPAVKAHFDDCGGFREATTVMPSVSGPAHLPMFTGCYPGRCNIPGIRWFDRKKYAGSIFQRGRYRSYMGLNKVARMTREVSPEIPSVWNSFPDGGGMFAWFDRGMQPGSNLTRGLKTVTMVKSWLTNNWESGDVVVGDKLIQAAKGDRSFLYAVFPTVDELGHKNGPLDESSVEAYRSFDRYLPRLYDALTASGTADRTLIAITSDHGQSTTHTHFDLAGFVKPLVSRLMHFPFAWKHIIDCDAVSNVSGNSLAHLSFRGPDGWVERPDVTKVGSPAHTVIEALLERNEIELLVYREEGRLRVRGNGGSALIWRDENGLHYAPEAVDPFGYANLESTYTSDLDALGATFQTQHPDALVQLEQLFWSERCGDVVVMAREGFDLRTHFEYQDHRGSHGGTWWEHMKVPLLVNAPIPDEPVRNVDVLPTALQACGKPIPDGIDGRSLYSRPKA